MRVLVTNASYWNALAAVRALAKSGAKVFVAGPWRRSFVGRQGVAFWSRYCSGRSYYTDPAASADRFAADIASVLKRKKIDVLLPVGIKEVMAVLRFEDMLRPLTAIPFGSFETVARANNKETAVRTAEAVSVPVPHTAIVEKVSELPSLGVKLPLVVKTCVGAASQGVWYVTQPSDWEKIKVEIEKLRTFHPEESTLFFNPHRLLIQEYVPGDVHDVCVLADHGRVRAMVTQKRLKTASLKGGGGLMNVTTNVPQLEKYARRLIEELEYHGVAQLEFKHDPRDGQYKLLEINAKFWGTLALSIAAGVNFPYLAALMALGRPFKDSFDYQVGLIYRWRFPGEVLSWAREWSQGAKFSSLWSSPPGEVMTDWRWSDPLPSVHQVLTTIWKLCQGEWKRENVKP